MRLFVDRAVPISPAEASRALATPLSKTSYHFNCLAKAGAIALQRRETIPQGVPQHFYTLAPELFDEQPVTSILDLGA